MSSKLFTHGTAFCTRVFRGENRSVRLVSTSTSIFCELGKCPPGSLHAQPGLSFWAVRGPPCEVARGAVSWDALRVSAGPSPRAALPSPAQAAASRLGRAEWVLSCACPLSIAASSYPCSVLLVSLSGRRQVLAFWGFKLHRSGLELGAEGEVLTSDWEGFGGLTSCVVDEQKFRVFKENYFKNVSMTHVSVPDTVCCRRCCRRTSSWASGGFCAGERLPGPGPERSVEPGPSLARPLRGPGALLIFSASVCSREACAKR